MKDPTRKSFVADLAASSRLAKASSNGDQSSKGNADGDEPLTPAIGDDGAHFECNARIGFLC